LHTYTILPPNSEAKHSLWNSRTHHVFIKLVHVSGLNLYSVKLQSLRVLKYCCEQQMVIAAWSHTQNVTVSIK